MKRLKKRITMILAVGLISTFGIIGCSSKPTQEEMTQLENVQTEIKSLEQRKNVLEQERATISQSIAGKEAQLRKCEMDKTAVSEKLNK